MSHADSQVLPDSVLFEGISYYFDHSAQELKLKVPVIFVNSRYLIAISAPFVWSGPVSLDSASFAGGRVEHADVPVVYVDSLNNKLMFGMVQTTGPDIPAGRGLLGTIYFSILDAGYLDIDTTFFPPSSRLQFQDNHPIDWTPEFVQLHFHIQNVVYFEPAPGSQLSLDGDTFYVDSGGDIRVNVNLTNLINVFAFTVPLTDECYDGTIFLDSLKNDRTAPPLCFEGSRVPEDWGAQVLNLDLYPPWILFGGIAVTADPLPPGDGPLATLTFTALDSGSVCLDTFFTPAQILLEIVDQYAVSHIPAFAPDTFQVRTCPYIPGDLNWDQIVDLLDLPLLIYYLFRDWEAPCPLKAADVNCDQEVGLVDVVYLINYIFRSGPPPQTCEY